MLAIAKYSDIIFKKQAIVGGFSSLQEMRTFMNVFRLMYPEYWLHEFSKISKFFCISNDMSDSDCDWKDIFQRSFKDQVTNVSIVSGQEALASDFKLLKNPMMTPFLPLRTIIVEFTCPAFAFGSLLLNQEKTIEHE